MKKHPGFKVSPNRLLLPFTFAKATSPDQKHPERNEDYLLADRESGLVVICDGVGCVSKAGQAARVAARTARTYWRHSITQCAAPSPSSVMPVLDLERVLQQMLNEVNQAVLTLEKRLKKSSRSSPRKKTVRRQPLPWRYFIRTAMDTSWHTPMLVIAASTSCAKTPPFSA